MTLPIIVDRRKRTVALGKYKTSRYEKVITLHEVFYENGLSKEYLEAMGKAGNGEGYKALWELSAKHFGPKALPRLEASLYYLWIEPHKDLLLKKCFIYGSRGRRYLVVNEFFVGRFWRYKRILLQLEKDGITHLAPFCITFGKDPSQLKAMLGGLWKVIARNSVSRNKLLIRSLIEHVSVDARMDLRVLAVKKSALPGQEFTINCLSLKQFRPFVIKALSNLVHVKSYILSMCSIGANSTMGDDSSSVIRWISENTKGICREGLLDACHIVTDTKAMANTLERPFSLKWSCSRMMNEHDKLTDKFDEDSLSGFSFNWLKDYPKRIESNGSVATLISTPDMLFREGKDMSHCIISYGSLVESRDYVVYSLIADGERATLGLDLDWYGGLVVVFDQCYQAENTSANRGHIALANKVIEEFYKHSGVVNN